MEPMVAPVPYKHMIGAHPSWVQGQIAEQRSDREDRDAHGEHLATAHEVTETLIAQQQDYRMSVSKP